MAATAEPAPLILGDHLCAAADVEPADDADTKWPVIYATHGRRFAHETPPFGRFRG